MIKGWYYSRHKSARKAYASLFHVPLTSPTSCAPEDLPIPWEPLKVKLPQYRTIYYDTGRHFAKLEIRFKLAARGSAPCTPGRPGKPLASTGRSKTCNYINSFDREGISKGHCSHLRRYYVGAVPFKGHFISVKIEYLSVSVRSCDHCKVRAICVPAMSALRGSTRLDRRALGGTISLSVTNPRITEWPHAGNC